MSDPEQIFALIQVPGWPRRIAIACVSALAAAASIFIAGSLKTNDLGAAFAILSVSIICFSGLAWLSFDCLLGWRLVDILWICASLAAVVVALTNISETERRSRLFQAKLEMSQAFLNLLYTAQGTVTNDCEELPTTADMSKRPPEPYKGACDRMKHFIPQIEYDYNQFTTSPDAKISNVNGWGKDIKVPAVPAAPVGSWARLYDSAERFTTAVQIYEKAIEQNEPNLTTFQSFLLSTDLKYWYFFIAFFVGLRISKTTAEILQVQASARHTQH